MSDAQHLRRLRSTAWQAALRRLRAEYKREQKDLCAAFHDRPNTSQSAATELRRRHPARAAELYREEVLARGLPAPKPQKGRWPT